MTQKRRRKKRPAAQPRVLGRKTRIEVQKKGGRTIKWRVTETEVLGHTLNVVRTKIKDEADEISDQLRHRVYFTDGWQCCYCGKENVDLTCDHVQPQSRGGGTTYDNLITACRICNSTKNAKTPGEWGKLPQYGRFYVPTLEQLKWITREFGRMRGYPEVEVMKQALGSRLSFNAVVYGYARYRQWDLEDTRDYLYRNYGYLKWGKQKKAA